MEEIRHRRWIWLCIVAATVLIGVGLRLPAVRAGYPYLSYVDEGHLLHPVRKLLLTGKWKADENNYPQLPVRAMAGAARLAELTVPGKTKARLEAELRTVTAYDVIRPPELLLVARWLSLLLSAGIVVLVGFYARRLAGDAAGAVAALAAALLPALVLRGAIVTVDVYATFFVIAALAIVAGVSSPRQWLRIAAAGAFCGLAAVSKYPAGLVGLAVVLELLLLPWRWSERLRVAAVAGAAGAAAAVLAMPALVVEPGEVWERVIFQRDMYTALRLGSYWDQVVHYAEWDLPAQSAELGVTFLVLALAGLAVGVATRRWRRPALGWLLFGGLLVGLHARYAFQAFRNLLPLAALGCVAFALLVAWVGQRLRWPRLVAALAAALLLALFLRVDFVYARERRALVDSRSEAVEWLANHGARGSGVLVVAETVVAPLELARLGRPTVVKWEAARRHVLRARPRYLLVPNLRSERGPLISAADNATLLDRYEIKATFGHVEGVLSSPYRGNRLRVYVLERRPGARRSLKAPTSAETGANSSSGKFSGLSQNSPSPPAPHDS
ncbi:MAG TPA: glycosyltransferase family 39 protein [Thermoanaerobaculia bacterium]|nr:glycosyltransferase family 39 protein [Thermoanaerobaculia bacterium]